MGFIGLEMFLEVFPHTVLLFNWFIDFSYLNQFSFCIISISFSTYLQDLAVVVLLILIPLISPSSSKGGVIIFSSTFLLAISKNSFNF